MSASQQKQTGFLSKAQAADDANFESIKAIKENIANQVQVGRSPLSTRGPKVYLFEKKN